MSTSKWLALMAGVFFLLWGTIFLTWATVETGEGPEADRKRQRNLSIQNEQDDC
ncbi:hypothetical protein HWD94_20950 [Pseudarthrobacter equi]|uniref:hypothetical protein n=1 Tax=Pseudarthrobacter equi TaxID=728066 RepID=UPI0021BF471D|nr:hypothetical protein [Pseudarthrobacter equi]MCT9627563.1 hypothetical protein [Pseudarthrobacter equi]